MGCAVLVHMHQRSGFHRDNCFLAMHKTQNTKGTTQNPGSSVVLLSTQPATVLQDYVRLLAMVELEPTLLEYVILLPYSASSFPQPGNFTPPWQLEGSVLALRALGAAHIALLGKPPQADDLIGLSATARRLGVGWQAEISSATLLVLLPSLRRMPGVRLGTTLWLADHVAHSRLSLYHKLQRCIKPTSRLDTSLLEHIPTLAVMDATTIGNGANDCSDRPQIANLLLASCDGVALDAIGARLLGLDGVQDVAALLQAQQLGLGTADLEHIRLCGDTTILGLRFPPCLPHRPWRSRSSYTAWRYETSWGKLFSMYHGV